MILLQSGSGQGVVRRADLLLLCQCKYGLGMVWFRPSALKLKCDLHQLELTEPSSLGWCY